MQIINNTKFNVEAIPSYGLNKRPKLTIIVKGSFKYNFDGHVELLKKQMPIFYCDQLFDEQTSVKFESDIVPFKEKTDIVLIGHAYTKSQKPTKKLNVKLSVDKISKSLNIIGDRELILSKIFNKIQHTEPKPFTKMPIRYEYSYGGYDPFSNMYYNMNPVGKGFIYKKKAKALNGLKLPNIEDIELQIDDLWKKRPIPAGFGFYSKTWSIRTNYLGTYDEVWRSQRSPCPPEDFSYLFYNAAHPDLQLESYLSGNEEVTLTNLTQTHENVNFIIPKINLNCIISMIDSFNNNIKLNLDTLCLLPDENIFYLVWRGLTKIDDISLISVSKITINS